MDVDAYMADLHKCASEALAEVMAEREKPDYIGMDEFLIVGDEMLLAKSAQCPKNSLQYYGCHVEGKEIKAEILRRRDLL